MLIEKSLKSAYAILCFAFVFTGCTERECYNAERLSQQELKVEEWELPLGDRTVTFEDTEGKTYQIDYQNFGRSDYSGYSVDECNMKVTEYSRSWQINSADLPYRFSVNSSIGISKYTLFFQSEYPEEKSGFYRFVTGASERELEIAILENEEIDGINYDEILSIDFPISQNPESLKKLYFAKEKGIVFISTFGGENYQLVE